MNMKKSTQEGPKDSVDNMAFLDRVYAYASPQDPRSNPKGNPHGIKLPDSVAQRVIGETPVEYEKRISDEITAAMYGYYKTSHGWVRSDRR
jgi:hypothetical protein